MNLLECLSAFVRLLLTSTLLVASALAQTPAYTVIPSLPPSSAGRALAADINDKGSVAATRLLTGTQPQAFVWRHGRSEILPTLGGTCSFGSGINDLEHVVGTSCLAGDTIQHAYLWRHNHSMDLDTFGGTGSGAVGVNRLDEIVGEYSLSDGSTHGYFWQNGEWADVGSLGGSQTFPGALNDSGVVTGQSDISNTPDPVFGIPPFHGFLWDAGVLTDFGQIFGSNFNYGNAIDAAGKIVGSADLPGDAAAHAILWDHGSVEDLGTLPADQVSWALGINNQGQIVGASGLFDYFDPIPPVNNMLCPCHGVLWENGAVLFLDGFVDPSWSILLALAINDEGEIIPLGQQNGAFDHQQVVLKPIKNASSLLSGTARCSGTNNPGISYSGPGHIRRGSHGCGSSPETCFPPIFL